MPKCKFCQKDIKWKYPYTAIPLGEKNFPYNLDGSLHDCRPKKEEPEPKPSDYIHDPKPEYDYDQALITELTKHTHLLEAILEAVSK